MRKVVAGQLVSVDGIVEAPERWTGPYFTPEIGQEYGSVMAQGDTLLLGRRTYETFAASFGGQTGGMADMMNDTLKVVVSKTLDKVEWQNSTLLEGDPVQELTRLKQQDGKNININGSATLVRSLLHDGLIDELRLTVFPVVVGAGARLFEGYGAQLGLELADSKEFSSGVVNLVYHPR
jgi:dihydrofolate reductase